jgi:hypothetical protein
MDFEWGKLELVLLMLGVYLWMFYLAAHSWDVAFLMVWLK